MVNSAITKLILKSGISLYSGQRQNEFFIGTLRSRLAIYSPSAPAIYACLKRGVNSAELAASLALSADDLSDLVEQLYRYEFIESQSSAIKISERFISNIAERAAKSGDHSKDASFAQIKNRTLPELTVARWLPGVFDSGVSKVSARQNAHIEISGKSRAVQHLYAALIASGVTHTQLAPSFRRGEELISDNDLSGGYISATDIGQEFRYISNERSKSLALFPLSKSETAEELPIDFSEKVIKIHFGQVDPVIHALWMASGQEHLIVSEISGGYLTISPIVKPGHSPCSRCCELTIADQCGATFLEGPTVGDEIPISGANFLAGLLASEIIKLIDTGSCTLSNEAISIDLLDLCNTKHITIGRHPMCGCSWR
jgi:hypothetical protein